MTRHELEENMQRISDAYARIHAERRVKSDIELSYYDHKLMEAQVMIFTEELFSRTPKDLWAELTRSEA